MTKQNNEEKVNLKESLEDLRDIVNWFEEQEEIDVEAGLEKVKKGAELIKICKNRLIDVENEFKEIQKEIEE